MGIHIIRGGFRAQENGGNMYRHKYENWLDITGRMLFNYQFLAFADVNTLEQTAYCFSDRLS